MTPPTVDPADQVYEVTLSGALGPVLCNALSPVGLAHLCTVVRGESPTEIDLADIVASLDAHGLRVEALCLLGQAVRPGPSAW